MATLVAGLVVFLGIHLLPTLPSLRTAGHARLGEKRYRAMFALVSFAGLALIVVGYRAADPAPRLFAPLPVAITIAPYAMVISFVLFAAANMRTRLRRAVGHPMLLGLAIWSAVHLCANGDTRGSVLFGAFLVYAVVDLASAIHRHAVRNFTPAPYHDLIAVVSGTALALLVMAFHRMAFGFAVVPFSL